MGFKVSTKTIKKLDVRKLKKRLDDQAFVVVGLPKDSNNYPDGTSVIMVGLVHEFGNDVNPERSFLRSGIRANLAKYRRLNRRNLKLILAGKMKTAKALGLLGITAAGDVRDRINAIQTPPLLPATIKRKDSAKPLIDIGHLKNSITHEVRNARR